MDARELRREKRRGAAARSCLARLALEASEARLESLAQDAGLTRQALLFYFADKEEVRAEAATCAAEDACAVLARRVRGEEGSAAIRALRRGLDELASVTPDAFAVWLDAGGAPPRTTVAQQARAREAHERLLGELVGAIAGPRGDREGARRLAQLAWLALVALHREARVHARSGFGMRPQLAGDLDFTESQLVALAQSFRGRRT